MRIPAGQGERPRHFRRAGREAAIDALQRAYGNAFVARRLAAVARAAGKDEDPADRERARGVEPGQRPPGYRPEGPVPELAKPAACGQSERPGNKRFDEFYPDHVQDGVHSVAHELETRSGATCDPKQGGGFSVRLADLLAGLTRVPWNEGTFEDVWTDGARAGVVYGVGRKPDGAISYNVDVFESCRKVGIVETGGRLYRKG